MKYDPTVVSGQPLRILVQRIDEAGVFISGGIHIPWGDVEIVNASNMGKLARPPVACTPAEDKDRYPNLLNDHYPILFPKKK